MAMLQRSLLGTRAHSSFISSFAGHLLYQPNSNPATKSYLWLGGIAKDVPILGCSDLEGHGWKFLRA